MIYELNRIVVKTAEEAAFEHAFAAARRLLLRVPGCLSATLLRCIERPGHYLLQVGWDRIESHIETYAESVEAARVRSLLLPLIASADPAHYETASPA